MNLATPTFVRSEPMDRSDLQSFAYLRKSLSSQLSTP